MKILFYISYLDEDRQAWCFHLAKRYAVLGDEIQLIFCGGALLSCHALKACKHESLCVACTSRAEVLVEALRKYCDPKVLRLATRRNTDVSLPADRKSLVALSYRGVPIGLGVESTLLSFTRDPDYTIDSVKEAVEKNLMASMTTIDHILDNLVITEFDKVYICNGRFSELRPLVEICKLYGVDFYTFESGYFTENVEVFENTLPQDIEAGTVSILRTWGNGGDDKENEGADWFRKRKNRVQIGYEPVLSSKQHPGEVPLIDTKRKYKVAIYNSSEDETAALGEFYVWNGYRNQLHAISLILELADEYPDIHFILRIHPNLIGNNAKQTEMLRQLSHPQLTVIPPESTVDSYALLDFCDRVLVFNSTMGVEACFWEKPCVLFGRAAYEGLDVAYPAATAKDVLQILSRKDLTPKPRLGALKYAYASVNRGESTLVARGELAKICGGEGKHYRIYRSVFKILTAFRIPVSRIPGYKFFMKKLCVLAMQGASRLKRP